MVAGVGLQLNRQDAQKRVLWEGPMEVIEAPKVQPSAFYSLLCDESEQDPMSGDDLDQGSTAAGQEAANQVC
jgi:hypothetical protein